MILSEEFTKEDAKAAAGEEVSGVDRTAYGEWLVALGNASYPTVPEIWKDQTVKFRVHFPSMCPGTYPVRYVYQSGGGGVAETETIEYASVTFEPDKEFATGWISLTAPPGKYKRIVSAELFPVGCDTLTAVQAGQGFGAIGSVDIQFTLGQLEGGLPPGLIFLYGRNIDASLYSPTVLRFGGGVDSTEVRVVRDAAGVLRQVKTPEALASIATLNSASYEVRFFRAAQAGQPNPSTGLYSPTGSAFATYVIRNPDAGTAATNRLEMVETRGANTKSTLYTQNGNTWEMNTGNGERVEVVANTYSGNDLLARRRTVKDRQGKVVADSSESWRPTLPSGRELIQSTPDMSDPVRSHQYLYYGETGNGVNNGRLREHKDPNYHWERYFYDEKGRVTRTISQWLSNPSSDSETANRTTDVIHATSPDQDGDGIAETLVSTVTRLLGTEIARSYRLELSSAETQGGNAVVTSIDVTCTAPRATLADASNQVTKTKRIKGGLLDGRVVFQFTPDQTLQVAGHVVTPETVTTTTSLGVPNAARDGVVSGRRTVTVANRRGREISREVTDISSGLRLEYMLVTQTDEFDRATRIEYGDGTFETFSYACCGLESTTDRTGRTATYTYDLLGRVRTATLDGRTQRFEYDPEGRLLSTTRVGDDDSAVLVESAGYDLRGRRIWSKDAANRRTDYRYGFTASLDSETTTTNPVAGATVEVSFMDQSLRSVSVSGTAQRSHEYGVDDSGVFTKQTLVGENGATTEWTRTYTDFVGRTYKTVHADGATAQSYYNALGQLAREVDPDGVTALYAYDAQGRLETTAIDLNRNGVIDYNGLDRITRVTREYASAHGTVVERVTTTRWTTDNAATTEVVSVVESSVDGRQTWQTQGSLTASSSTTYTGAGARTETSTGPDGTRVIRQFNSDRLVFETTSHPDLGTLAQATYAYDAHGRLKSTTDPRSGTTTLTYYDDDKIRTVTSPDPDTTRTGPGYDLQTTTYEYDAAGRLWKTTQPDGGIVTNEYYPTGLLKKTSGARTYPQQYTYDPQGRLASLTTWRDHASATGAAVTTWAYDPQRGWLTSKRDATTQGPAYTYWPSGRLKTRAWARGVSTAYAYTPGGELRSIDYGDATPDVSHTYDRRGRLVTSADAAGLLTRTYTAFDQLDDETYSGTGALPGFIVTRDFDPFQRASGRTVTIPGAAGLTTSHTYDAASRLRTVATAGHTATYAYVPNAPGLVASLSISNGSVNRLTSVKTYDSLNRLAAINNTQPATSAAYTYNSANQRTRLTREDASRWDYTYDALGQVTTARKRLPDDTTILGLDHGWTYDDIGNRKTATANGQTATYTADALNQYTQRTVPPVIEASGTAALDATVSLVYPATGGTITRATRQGERFFGQAPSDNTAALKTGNLKVVGVKNLAGPAGEDAVTEETRPVFLPRSPETYTYDADGNLTADGRWAYTWDAENRLIALETNPAAVAGGVVARRLEFTYDAGGRRIGKKVFTANGATWTLASDTRFLYDGWNMVAEVSCNTPTATFSLLRSYTWGLDLSGSPQGAGGVGGLLLVKVGTATYAPTYDGNGNIIGAVDTATGTSAAEYEYSAFGETLRATGPAASAIPFRFSTKFTDTETGLLYYGFRYYNATTGRWLSRDPIEESGGLNLYGILENDTVNAVDLFGLKGNKAPPATEQAIALIQPILGALAEARSDCACYAKVISRLQAMEFSIMEDAGFEPFFRHYADFVALLKYQKLASNGAVYAAQVRDFLGIEFEGQGSMEDVKRLNGIVSSTISSVELAGNAADVVTRRDAFKFVSLAVSMASKYTVNSVPVVGQFSKVWTKAVAGIGREWKRDAYLLMPGRLNLVSLSCGDHDENGALGALRDAENLLPSGLYGRWLNTFEK